MDIGIMIFVSSWPPLKMWTQSRLIGLVILLMGAVIRVSTNEVSSGPTHNSTSVRGKCTVWKVKQRPLRRLLKSVREDSFVMADGSNKARFGDSIKIDKIKDRQRSNWIC